MSNKLSNIIEVKNILNQAVNSRKEDLAKIESHRKKISMLERDIEIANTKQPLDTLLIDTATLQIRQLQTIIQTLEINIQNFVYEMDNELTTEQDEKFASLVHLFNDDICLFTQTENGIAHVEISFVELNYIQCKHKAIKLAMLKKTHLVIYPTIVLVEDENNSFYIVPITALEIAFKKGNTKGQSSSDQAQNSKHEIHVTIPTMFDEQFFMEDEKMAIQFEATYSDYITYLNELIAPPLKGIRKEYYQLVTDFGNKFIEFLKRLNENENFVKYVTVTKKLAESVTFSNYIEAMALIDLLKCFNTIADIKNTTSNESFSVMYLQSRFLGMNIANYEDIIKLNNPNVITHYNNLIESVWAELKESPNSEKEFFNLAELLRHMDKDLFNEYLSIIYQYSSIVVKADGKVTKAEEEALKKIMITSSEKAMQKAIYEDNKIVNQKTLEELIYELYDLTGLQNVKQEINTLINIIKVQKAREQFDLKNTDMNLHLVFAGNPGTGKTTVARHLASIYKCLGVLSKGHLVETDRSGMIAEYVGQTAIKVNKLVDSALNGVLFIDEAYAILIDDKDTYGKEAIATLLKRMEDDRDKLIVVLAGYTNEMAAFISSNPGMKSRFNKYIHFADYTSDELYSIFISMTKKLHFVLEDSLPDRLKLLFLEEIEKGDSSFGNGRFVRNVFEKMLENQANRLAYDVDLSKEKLTMLKAEDLPVF
jgi:ATP-dependent 26S proteasome regulatory subunit